MCAPHKKVGRWGSKLRLEAGHVLQLKEVLLVEPVDALLLGLILDLSGADIPIQLRVGEAQIVLVGLAGEAVDGGLVHQMARQSQGVADLLDLGHRQLRER